MKRVFFLCVEDKRILLVDLSGIKEVKESEKILDRAEIIISRMRLKSLLLLTDVIDANYDMSGIDRLKTFSKNVTPYVKKSAVAGSDGEKGMIVDILQKITGREIRLFSSRGNAINWLIEN